MSSLVTLHNLEKLVQTSGQVLLLQGPNGDFFSKFSQWLGKHHKAVFKLNLNGGDEYFYPNSTPNTFAYRDTLANFDHFLSQFISDHHIDTVVCFGDTRPYHRIAKQLCVQKEIKFWAFEEGYFRPYYVTLGEYGVNANTMFPQDAQFFLDKLPTLAHQGLPRTYPVPLGFRRVAWASMLYYFWANLRKAQYPHYVHHREMSISCYIGLWLSSGWKKLCRYFPEKVFARDIKAGKYGRFFLLPLQVYNDSQVRVHSDFPSIAAVLSHVLRSFALHAPKESQLVVKHHPMDRGFVNYQRIFDRFFKRYPDLKGRVHYIYDVPLPVLLRSAAGVVTLNSTSGISALIHRLPVKVLGRASYDIPGVTDQQPLDDFWHHPCEPDHKAFDAYRTFHLNVTQINGSFYSHVRLPEC